MLPAFGRRGDPERPRRVTAMDSLGAVAHPRNRSLGASVLLAEQNAAKALSVCARAVVVKLGVVADAGPAAALAASDAVRAAFLGGG